MRKKVSLLMLLAFCSTVAMEEKEEKNEPKGQQGPTMEEGFDAQEGEKGFKRKKPNFFEKLHKQYGTTWDSYQKYEGQAVLEAILKEYRDSNVDNKRSGEEAAEQMYYRDKKLKALSLKDKSSDNKSAGEDVAEQMYYRDKKLSKLLSERSWGEYGRDTSREFVDAFHGKLVNTAADAAVIGVAGVVGEVAVRPAVVLVQQWWYKSEIAAAQKQQANIEYQKANAEYGKSLGHANDTSLNRFEKLHAIAQKTGLLDRYAKHKVEIQAVNDKFLKIQKKIEETPESERNAFMKSVKKEIYAIQKEQDAVREKAGFSQSEASMIDAIEYYEATIGENVVKEAILLAQDCQMKLYDKEEKFMRMMNRKDHTAAE